MHWMQPEQRMEISVRAANEMVEGSMRRQLIRDAHCHNDLSILKRAQRQVGSFLIAFGERITPDQQGEASPELDAPLEIAR